MTHKEWKGDRELIERLLTKSGLNDVENVGELKTAMRWIIWYRYVDLMTVDESLARLIFDHKIDISVSKYHRILSKAIGILEKYL